MKLSTPRAKKKKKKKKTCAILFVTNRPLNLSRVNVIDNNVQRFQPIFGNFWQRNWTFQIKKQHYDPSFALLLSTYFRSKMTILLTMNSAKVFKSQH
jgi:hypothetical protein